MNKKNTASVCPCGSNQAFTTCCQPYLNRVKPALTAEALMRSRYTAFSLGDESYLLDSWHESTRPEALELEPDVQWIRLNVLGSYEDRVEFVATYRVNGKAHKLRENSRFVREEGSWYYLDGQSS